MGCRQMIRPTLWGLMADSALAAVQALDDQRVKLVDEFVRRAWNMWRSLTPSDWWNDAVAEGAAAYVTQQHIAFVKAMRQQGISYADTMLRLAGVNGLGISPNMRSFAPTRTRGRSP